MEEIDGYRREIITSLGNAASELSGMGVAWPASAWHTSGSRTAHYILAHLHALESQVFATQLPRIVEENLPLLPAFDDQSWMEGHYDPSQPVQALLDEFAHLRGQEVAWLRGLSTESWNCTARHPWWGVRTLQWWVELQLDYSRQHLVGISAVLAR